MMPYFMTLTWAAALAIGLVCGFRVLLAVLDPQSRAIFRRNRLAYLLGIAVGLVPVAAWYATFFWPPVWLEHVQQRKAVMAIVNAHGGWDEFRREAARLMDHARLTDHYQWFPSLNFGPEFRLPEGYPLISALTAQQVQVLPADSPFGQEQLKVKIFGHHSTGGRGESYYALFYVPNLPRQNETPGDFDRSKRRKLSDAVYEATGSRR